MDTEDKKTITETENSTMPENQKEAQKKKNKKRLDYITEKGKESTVKFVVTRILSYLLTIIISVVTTFCAQLSFKDDFDEYRADVFDPLFEEGEAIFMSVNYSFELKEADKILEDFEANKTKERIDDLVRKTVEYSSDNEDIMQLHDLCADVFYDIQDMIYRIYVGGTLDKAYTDSYRYDADEYLYTEGELTFDFAVSLKKVENKLLNVISVNNKLVKKHKLGENYILDAE